jgi:hypothetical protein
MSWRRDTFCPCGLLPAHLPALQCIMRLVLFSDIHSDLTALDRLIQT